MAPPAPEARGRVCVIDDDEDIRTVISDVLSTEGYDVVAAENGAVALERLRGGALPCLILLDLMMPVMDGWQFEAERAKDAALAKVPVVVISGAGRARADAGSLDAASVLAKPMDLERLLDVVERYCP